MPRRFISITAPVLRTYSRGYLATTSESVSLEPAQGWGTFGWLLSAFLITLCSLMCIENQTPLFSISLSPKASEANGLWMPGNGRAAADGIERNVGRACSLFARWHGPRETR
ncbi:hypothetical protein N7468_002233 [Penicillium chermesinum]|uniref:Uncharacterized protein n=1 Tax=Penicillium chermesinum TaxID=63820 RepID=A0A9W9PI53_9EURO|nr:uncharacterized protein N7468_002233 [Penicillium chermesinum]KAJ5247250.1 hypothetical protein N7468_002233 [Penicillium chermesinum]